MNTPTRDTRLLCPVLIGAQIVRIGPKLQGMSEQGRFLSRRKNNKVFEKG